MITTIDGHDVGRGYGVWEVGITVKGIYTPTRAIVHGGANAPADSDRCWKSFNKCNEECERLNTEEHGKN